MRIGLDAHILGKGKGGVERVVHQMVRLLPGLLPSHEFVVFVNKSYQPLFPARPNLRYVRLAVAEPIVQRSVLLPWLAQREQLDLLHVQSAAPPFIRSRLVVHTHDLLPLTAPRDHAGLRDRLVRQLTPGTLRRADGVLTVSESVAGEIRALFPFTARKLTSIPNGIEGDFFQPRPADAPRAPIHTRFGLGSEYLLYIGAFAARKNLEVAIRGFGRFLRDPAHAAARQGVKLVLAGMCRSQSYLDNLHRLAAEVAPGAVVFTGFISDRECLELLQHARIFLAPSRGEGFDLPPLEAMSCAIPVICSDLPVHHELLEDDALYFRSDQPDGLAAAMSRLDTDPGLHRQLSRRGPPRAARFTWENTMSRMADFYHTVFPSRLSFASRHDVS